MEFSAYVRFVLALILVVGLILALAWALKRIGFGGSGPLTRHRRVRVVESTLLDGRHRLALIRRDDVEHLILVGPNTSQVVERGIPAPPDTGVQDTPSPSSPFRRLLTKDAP